MTDAMFSPIQVSYGGAIQRIAAVGQGRHISFSHSTDALGLHPIKVLASLCLSIWGQCPESNYHCPELQ